jgi:hypothetical protein
MIARADLGVVVTGVVHGIKAIGPSCGEDDHRRDRSEDDAARRRRRLSSAILARPAANRIVVLQTT